MKMNSKKVVGDLGELTACKFLKKNKYKIVCNNYSNKFGEIDIICENKAYIVFVEVKTRKKGTLVSGVHAVNKKKQLNIFKTADAYIKEHSVNKQPRFDIIEVEYDVANNSATVLEHYIDAFSQGGNYAVF